MSNEPRAALLVHQRSPAMLVLASVVFVVVVASVEAVEKNKYSNLIVVLTDQQRWNTIRLVQEELGIPEKSRIQTPNLDRIAREGAYFRNAYTHCAVCGPARASLLTGEGEESFIVRVYIFLPNLNTNHGIAAASHSYC